MGLGAGGWGVEASSWRNGYVTLHTNINCASSPPPNPFESVILPKLCPRQILVWPYTPMNFSQSTQLVTDAT